MSAGQVVLLALALPVTLVCFAIGYAITRYGCRCGNH